MKILSRKLFLIMATIIMAMSLSSCSPPSTPIAWQATDVCELRLVGYRVQKAAYYYLEEIGTGAIFTFRPQGTWQFPTIALGDSVQSRCTYKMNVRHTEWVDKQKSITSQKMVGRPPSKTLPSYEYLLK